MALKISGTGKTLSLLCATLGWISKQKEIKQAWTSKLLEDSDHDDVDMQGGGGGEEAGANKENDVQNNTNETNDNLSWQPINMADEIIPMEKIPQVIYASRTHSQLTQGKLYRLFLLFFCFACFHTNSTNGHLITHICSFSNN